MNKMHGQIKTNSWEECSFDVQKSMIQAYIKQNLLNSHILDALTKFENLEDSFSRRSWGFPCSTCQKEGKGLVTNEQNLETQLIT